MGQLATPSQTLTRMVAAKNLLTLFRGTHVLPSEQQNLPPSDKVMISQKQEGALQCQMLYKFMCNEGAIFKVVQVWSTHVILILKAMHVWCDENIAIIAKAALHKLREKSSLNVRSACPVCAVCPGCPVCPDAIFKLSRCSK